MQRQLNKKIIVVAGPNGSGKTTFAESYLRSSLESPIFLNPDLIASGISKTDFEKASFQAGRILLKEVKDRIIKGESFSFESTLSGRTWFPILKNAKEKGYEVVIYFLMLKKVNKNLERIDRRVQLGGHSIPKEAVLRRHGRVFENFWCLYRSLASNWYIFDNSDEAPRKVLSLHDFEGMNEVTRNKFVLKFLKGQLNGR